MTIRVPVQDAPDAPMCATHYAMLLDSVDAARADRKEPQT